MIEWNYECASYQWLCGWGCSDWGFLTYEAAHDAYVEHRCDGVLEP